MRKGNTIIKFEERQKIDQLYGSGHTVMQIASELGRAYPTIEREIVKGWTGGLRPDGQLEYSAEKAQERYEKSLAERFEKLSKVREQLWRERQEQKEQ